MQGEAKHCKSALDNRRVQQEITRSKASDTWAQTFIAIFGLTKLLFILKHTGSQSSTILCESLAQLAEL